MVIVDGWRGWWLLLGLCFLGFFLAEKCDLTLGEPQDLSGEVMWGWLQEVGHVVCFVIGEPIA